MCLGQARDATDAIEAIDAAKAFVEGGSEVIGSHLSNILVSGFNKGGKPKVTGQLAGVSWLRQQPWVDCARIGVFGWSYGGYMSLMLLAKASNRITAGVAVAPVTDWTLYDTHYTEHLLDTLQHNPQGYELSGVLTGSAAGSRRCGLCTAWPTTTCCSRTRPNPPPRYSSAACSSA
jgi:hypothetical protein